MAKEEAEEPEVGQEDSFFETNDEHYVLVMSFDCDNHELAKVLEISINTYLDRQWVFRPGEKQTVGIIKASEYNSQAQHYVFLKNGDLYQKGDEFYYRPEWKWLPIESQFFGKPIKGGMSRRKVV